MYDAEDHQIRPGEIVIEIDNERHEVYQYLIRDAYEPLNIEKQRIEKRTVVSGNAERYFPPAGRNVRGRQYMKRFGPPTYRLADAALDIEYVPGERIHVDLENGNGVGRITDGIMDKDNAELRKFLTRRSGELPFPFSFGPNPAYEIRFPDDYARWTWLYWMKRTVQDGCANEGPRMCRPIQGIDRLPSIEDCIKSRKVLIHFNGEVPVAKILDDDRQKNEPNYDVRSSRRHVLTPELMGTA